MAAGHRRRIGVVIAVTAALVAATVAIVATGTSSRRDFVRVRGAPVTTEVELGDAHLDQPRPTRRIAFRPGPDEQHDKLDDRYEYDQQYQHDNGRRAARRVTSS